MKKVSPNYICGTQNKLRDIDYLIYDANYPIIIIVHLNEYL